MAEVKDIDATKFEPCPPELCEKARFHINQVCLDYRWPPGTPVLMDQGDGKFCECKCL